MKKKSGSADTDHYLFVALTNLFREWTLFFLPRCRSLFVRFYGALFRILRFCFVDVSQFIVFEMSDAHGHSCTGTHFRTICTWTAGMRKNHSHACVMRTIDCNNIYKSWVGLQQILFELVNWNETWQIDDDKDYERQYHRTDMPHRGCSYYVDVFTVPSAVQLRVQAQICADACAIWMVFVSLLVAKLQAHRFECYRMKFDFHVDLPVHLPKIIWLAARVNYNATAICMLQSTNGPTDRHIACRSSVAIFFQDFPKFRSTAVRRESD